MEKLHIPHTENLLPHQFLVSDDLLGDWRIAGLPQDDLSKQNAVITFLTDNKFPLLVDPQGQGRNWAIRKAPPDKTLFTTLSSKSYLNLLEDAIVHGKAIIIEDVDADLPKLNALRTVMTKTYTKALDTDGKSWVNVVTMGNKELAVSSGFSLTLCTRHATPPLTPELYAQVVVVECAVTPQGLEDQLLSTVIRHEKASLEVERAAVMQEISSCETTLHQCEQLMLTRLATSAGNLLDDTDLIAVLTDIKDKVLLVQQKLITAHETEANIESARNEFRPIAVRGRALFFALLEMSAINAMYVSSLDVYAALFEEALGNASPSAHAPKADCVSCAIPHIARSCPLYDWFLQPRQVTFLPVCNTGH